MSALPGTLNFDLKNAIAKNRLVGLWRLMTGFRVKYLRASLSLGVAALSFGIGYLVRIWLGVNV